MFVHINRKTSAVDKALCSCPADNSSYCNYIMALLYEIAEYSLKSYKVVPAETTCTSHLRALGVPGHKEIRKQAIMKTSLVADVNKKGMQSTQFKCKWGFPA